MKRKASLLSIGAALAATAAHGVQLQYNQPNFYDQSRALQAPAQPLTQGWPTTLEPQVNSPGQSPRSVDPGAIGEGYAIQPSEGGYGLPDRLQSGDTRQICKDTGTDKPECRWYEYDMAPPGKVPYEPPSWKIMPEDYKPE